MSYSHSVPKPRVQWPQHKAAVVIYVQRRDCCRCSLQLRDDSSHASNDSHRVMDRKPAGETQQAYPTWQWHMHHLSARNICEFHGNFATAFTSGHPS
jgi:hypothetical protein